MIKKKRERKERQHGDKHLDSGKNSSLVVVHLSTAMAKYVCGFSRRGCALLLHINGGAPPSQ